ncbi:MAG: hypothetical protein BRC23_01750 [Parcubacteria group bacterium SW_4_49_11]|nr:MAG: hypothetical protein BRC23_01750 [Parcubacteria group bacterium SW_4_49_11]
MVAAIGILAGIVVVAINPQRQLGKVRDAERQSEVGAIQDGIKQYASDTDGRYPSGIEVKTYKEVCDTEAVDPSSCPSDYVDLSELVPKQLAAIPRDPQASDTNEDTGYEVARDGNGNVTVKAPDTEVDTSAKRAGRTLSVAYSLSSASYDNNKAVTTRATDPHDAVFNGDGSKMFVVDNDKTKVYSYNLSTAYDIGSASYNQNLDVSGQDSGPTGMAFNGDGTKMFVVGYGNDMVYSYDMSTAYDLASASYNQSFDMSDQDGALTGVTFNGDGTKMFTIGYNDDNVYSYNVSTAYDLSTASYNQSFDVSGQDGGGRAVEFNGDGTKMYVSGQSNENIYSYNLSTAYDISSASYNQSFDTSGQDSKPAGVTFKDDGSKMIIAGYEYDDVYSYDVSTAYDISTASYNQNFDVSGEEASPAGVAFNGDGSKMFIVGYQSDYVHSYDLSTAYDLDTASYNQKKFDVSNQDGDPTDVTFNGDGTKMFVMGYDNSRVFSYDLSTAYDLNTASYNQNFSVSGQETKPTEVTFNGDGTKMFVIGFNNDTVYSYDLSTAYDISSASYNQSLDVSGKDGALTGIAFNDDGSKMFVAGYNNDNIYSYNMSASYDLSSASYNQKFGLSAQDGRVRDVRFNGEGTKMFIMGDDTDAVYRYSTGTEK